MLASCSNYADATWLQGYTGLRCSKFKVASRAPVPCLCLVNYKKNENGETGKREEKGGKRREKKEEGDGQKSNIEATK